MSLQPHYRRQVEATFDGGLVTSDGGALLLREVEARTGVIERMARCFHDSRAQARIEFTVKELLARRIFGLALGYEDLEDHDRLRLDPLVPDPSKRPRFMDFRRQFPVLDPVWLLRERILRERFLEAAATGIAHLGG